MSRELSNDESTPSGSYSDDDPVPQGESVIDEKLDQVRITKIDKSHFKKEDDPDSILERIFEHDSHTLKNIELNSSIDQWLQEQDVKYKFNMYSLHYQQHSPLTTQLSAFVADGVRETFLSEDKRTGYILLFYKTRIRKSEEIIDQHVFAVTTSFAWQHITNFADDSFTKAIERRTLAFPLLQYGSKNDSGKVIKESKTARPGHYMELDIWDLLDIHVTDRKRELRNNSSLYRLEPFKSMKKSPRVNISNNAITFHCKLSIVDLCNIFEHFSKICSRGITYEYPKNQTKKNKKTKELDDHRFEWLYLTTKVSKSSILKKLNASLHNVMREHMEGSKQEIYLTHPSVDKWLEADTISLLAYKDKMKRRRTKIQSWEHSPSLNDVMGELKKHCGSVCKREWLNEVNIKFGNVTAPLKKFICELFTIEEGSYIYSHGGWLEYEGHYLYCIEKDYVEKMKKHMIDDLPLLPWKHSSKDKSEEKQIDKQQVKGGVGKTKKNKELWKKWEAKFESLVEEMKALKNKEEILIETKAAQFHLQHEDILDEGQYNSSHALLNMLYPDRQIIVCDKVCPFGIELCDILIAEGNTTYMVHVKEGFGEQIRIVCSQIRNAADHIFRAQKQSAGTTIIDQYWKKLINGESTADDHIFRKKHLHKMTKDRFKKLFNLEREIVFVLACRDDRKTENFYTEIKQMSDPQSNVTDPQANVTDAMKSRFPDDKASRILKKLTLEGYITEEGSLTDMFIIEGKNNKGDFIAKLKEMDEIESDATNVFKALSSGLSRSRSTIAKMEIIRLVRDFKDRYCLGETRFYLKIYNINKDFSLPESS